MRINSPLCLLFFFASLVAVSISNAEDTTQFEAVGSVECADCKENNFKPSLAYSGLGVTIDCKLKNGEIKRFGASELDEEGNFKVSLPQELVQDGPKLKHECYAQLHSAAQIPCPAHDGLEAHKIDFRSRSNGKNTFGPTGNIRFSTALCTSKFLWPHFKYPPLPKIDHPWKKKFPKFFPPLKSFGHPWLHKPILPPIVKPLPPPVPIYKPLPPPVPVYKPKPKTQPKPKPLPPPVPVYKPKPKPQPKPKPLPPPVPVYKPKPKPQPKPKPPSVPIYKPPVLPPKKPCPPVIKPKPPVIVKPLPPPVPIYKPPVIVNPLPPPVPVYKPPVITKPLPPFYKKPCPPIPKLPPLPKIPPKYFHHPKFGKWPPLPPTIPHP